MKVTEEKLNPTIIKTGSIRTKKLRDPLTKNNRQKRKKFVQLYQQDMRLN